MINITHSDGAQNKAAEFKDFPLSITLICLPAMGVKAVFYKRFAENLCKNGFNVIIADWRGIGSSSIRASRLSDFGYEQLISDSKDLIDLANVQFPESKKVIVGHSLGGQIGALFASRYSNYVSALILITTCSVHYKSWQGWDKLRVFLAGCIFYFISKLWGYFPGNKVGFGGREAKTTMKDWCRNALTGKYELSNSDYNYDKALAELRLPVLALSIENDKLASKRSVQNFLQKLHPKTPIAHHHLTEKNVNISPLNHFSWAKKPDRIVELIKNWLMLIDEP